MYAYFTRHIMHIKHLNKLFFLIAELKNYTPFYSKFLTEYFIEIYTNI